MKQFLAGAAVLGLLFVSAAAEATTPLRRPGDPPVAPAFPKSAWPKAAPAPKHIPILALYTPERLVASGSLAALTAEVDDELAGLNESLLVTGVLNYDFVFSALQPADYHDSGSLVSDLDWIEKNWPAARLSGAGARLAHLFVGSGDLGGVSGAFHPGYPAVSNRPENAQNGRFVLAHEVGHNLALSHDPDNLATGGPGEWTNGEGFRMAGYRDVMAYANFCPEKYGTDCPIFAGYSDPARMRNGLPLGVLGVSEAVAVLRETLPVVAGDATCAASPQALCLQNNRFRATTFWLTAPHVQGPGQAIARTTDTGEFWFFAPTNIELIVKVLDGCALGGHYWVFAGGLTNVGVILKVTDTVTGAMQRYGNDPGVPYQPIQDTGAFPCQ
jgi:hypothetical protein